MDDFAAREIDEDRVRFHELQQRGVHQVVVLPTSIDVDGEDVRLAEQSLDPDHLGPMPFRFGDLQEVVAEGPASEGGYRT